MTDEERLTERAQGCLLGQLTGDALGSMVEFMPADTIRKRHPMDLREIGPSPVFHTLAGQPTDDSELALALTRTLLDGDGFDDERVAGAYGAWLESEPFDVGRTIGTAARAILGASARGASKVEAAHDAANRGSEANGALMRQSPLAVWGYALAPEMLADVVRRDTLLTHPNQVCQEDLARRFVNWLPIGRGKGEATTRAVVRLQAGVPWNASGEDSAGNGASMRAAPIGLLRWNDPGRLRDEAMLSALPTHREPMAVAGAVAMAAATAWLLTQGDDWTPEELVAAVQRAIAGIETKPQPERRDPSSLTTLHDRIGEIPRLLGRPPREALGYLYGGAFVLESLPSALYCFLRSRNDVEQTLLLAANAGYDTDTIAAMAGTLGGALGGVKALPKRLLPELEYRDELTALGVALHRLACHT